MNSKTENVMVMDCNTVANGIMHDINDIDKMERMLSSELSSADLFKIDCAIFQEIYYNSLNQGSLKQLQSNRPKHLKQQWLIFSRKQ